jgi:predicted nucleic acid-binding protein
VIVVIDASAMVDALVGNDPAPGLPAVLTEEELHAPALLDFEVASALRGHLLGARLEAVRASEALEDYGALTIERYNMTDLLADLIRLRHNFTVYDAAYIVLAQALDAPLVTVDGKLAEARRLGVDVQLLGHRQV